ncbi:LysR substrate-binding domain-containing protein [Robbsia sp. KACC 23696]|uniref:LysR substrate-binding domain-containing protein n=1 Tax=Robbsia sp. KACC 23696 TaxID=3149231 RepID=UPI00325A60AC
MANSDIESIGDLAIFALVAQHKGFRQAGRASNLSASALSEAVRRLENQLGIRLLLRTTRSVAPTEAGTVLLQQLAPALRDVRTAVDSLNELRDKPRGTLKLNVPVVAARLFLPPIVEAFIAAYPEIVVDIVIDNNFVDLVASGCDAGIRYEERLEQDMIAVPIGPRRQRYALAAAPAYLEKHGVPAHPKSLLEHACMRGRFQSGVMTPWEFEKDGQLLSVDVRGPLIVTPTVSDMAVSAAVRGLGLIYLFEEWLLPHLDTGALVPVLEEWWLTFPGPSLYYPGRRHLPAPLRAFVDFIQSPACPKDDRYG